MNTKTLGTIAVIFLALLGVWGLSQANYFNQEKKIKLGFEKISTSSVSKINIDNSKKIELTKSDSTWKVNEYEAASDKINSALSALKQGNISGPVSTNKKNFSKLGVGKNGLKITISQDNEKISFFLGDQGSNFNSTYLRKVDSNKVYKIDKNLSSNFGTKINFWRDKTILALGKNEVRQIKFDYPQISFSLSKNKQKWQAQRGNKTTSTDKQFISTFFANLDPLKADGFVDKKKFTQAQTKKIVTFKTQARKITLTLKKKKDSNNWYVNTSEKPKVYYKLPSYKANQLLVKPKELF